MHASILATLGPAAPTDPAATSYYPYEAVLEFVQDALARPQSPAARIIWTLARYARHSRLPTQPEDFETILAISAALAINAKKI